MGQLLAACPVRTVRHTINPAACMAETSFPVPVFDLVRTLAEIYRHEGNRDLVELLEHADARVDLSDYDNWNGGTYSWTITLGVPVALYARFKQAQLAQIEKELGERLHFVEKSHPQNSINVSLEPLAPGVAVVSSRLRPSERDVARLWQVNRFPLFISHVSAHKVAVGNLRRELAYRGIAGFVAHDDIEPSLEWQAEIELGLRSMHALAAILTKDFHASNWTDHEVGWALGRGMPVLPVNYDVMPYGLMGKFQALKGNFQDAGGTADVILRALLTNPQTQVEMRRCLIAAFCESDSFVMTQSVYKRVLKLRDLTDDEITKMRQACVFNRNVSDAFNVADAVFAKIGRPPPQPVESLDEDVPF